MSSEAGSKQNNRDGPSHMYMSFTADLQNLQSKNALCAKKSYQVLIMNVSSVSLLVSRRKGESVSWEGLKMKRFEADGKTNSLFLYFSPLSLTFYPSQPCQLLLCCIQLQNATAYLFSWLRRTELVTSCVDLFHFIF